MWPLTGEMVIVDTWRNRLPAVLREASGFSSARLSKHIPPVVWEPNTPSSALTLAAARLELGDIPGAREAWPAAAIPLAPSSSQLAVLSQWELSGCKDWI